MFDEKISIITASYNYARFLTDCIESVISQTYTNWELIIVDDGSSDNSIDVIKSYCQKDNRIKLFQHKNGKNKGLKDTLLLGLKHTNTEWVAFLEADDTFMPNYLEEKIKVIEKEPDVKFIFNNFEVIGDKSWENLPYYIQFQREALRKVGFHNYLKEFYTKNPVPTFSIVMTKKSILTSLDFNSPIKPALDRYLWSQIAVKNDFYFLNKKLSCWRKHHTSYYSQSKIYTISRIFYYIKTSLFIPDLLKDKILKSFFIFKLF